MPDTAERGTYNVLAAEDEHNIEEATIASSHHDTPTYKLHLPLSRHRLLRLLAPAAAALVLLTALALYLTSPAPPPPKQRVQPEDPSLLFEPNITLGEPLPRHHAVSAESIAYFRHVVDTRGLVQSSNSTLLVGLTNYGYRDFTYNWLCFTRRHNITNFLLACVDIESCDELRLLGYGRHLLLLDELTHDSTLAAECGGSSGTHQFRSACFNRQTKSKALLVLTSLLAGYNTLLTDMDISLVHNPLLYMPLQHDWEVQLEPHELCTGWYYNAATPIAIRMQSEVLYAMAQHPDLDDQVAYSVWTAYQLYVSGGDDVRRTVFPLNRRLFPIGQQFGAPDAVLWHNNWLLTADEKRQRMHEHNIYLYQQNNTADAAAAYIAQLPPESTRLDESGRRWPVWRPVNGSGVVASGPAEVLLVCAVCEPCVGLVPAVKPLRATFPGPLLTHNFTDYTAPWPEPLLDRIQ